MHLGLTWEQNFSNLCKYRELYDNFGSQCCHVVGQSCLHFLNLLPVTAFVTFSVATQRECFPKPWRQLRSQSAMFWHWTCNFEIRAFAEIGYTPKLWNFVVGRMGVWTSGFWCPVGQTQMQMFAIFQRNHTTICRIYLMLVSNVQMMHISGYEIQVCLGM